ncbi:hypothetical protein CONCODRAFT_87742 [Conidiobolus coronatus NRRL 28638]|uniref:RNI-like protein n=1 Tax=Conidiobolus coronatus (strain ATCC 28846 / CBS 209.66 / NRRL 28638) TaxID=796925 RepID=A0A137NSK5_CONC2|nr:hypothetical protein CONCODRAFT_87742 [Conidiobolus coronatus NRRL 28638]|eukprot:KXN65738.1 hypothetical protein CONCODRAFT_87742 [Conidiobolus coronatus NRRL 28638]
MLKLDNVNLFEITKQELSTNTEDLMSTIENLEIENCFVHIYNTPPEINKLIRTYSYGNPAELPHLQAIRVPNLKKLSIGQIRPNYIQRLLKLNPQVSHLTIKDESATKLDFEQISISKNLTKLSLYNLEDNENIIKLIGDPSIPKFNFIERLKLEFMHSDDCYIDDWCNILANFPNLIRLHLDLTYFNHGTSNLNDLLEINLGSLNNPIQLVLAAYERNYDEYNTDWDSYWYEFDWSLFTNVSELVLGLVELRVSEIEF